MAMATEGAIVPPTIIFYLQTGKTYLPFLLYAISSVCAKQASPNFTIQATQGLN